MNPELLAYARKLHKQHQGYARISELMAQRGVTLTPDEWCKALHGRSRIKPKEPVRAPKPMMYGETYLVSLRAGFDPFEANDAINECQHGRMPDYTGTACDCWKVAA